MDVGPAEWSLRPTQSFCHRFPHGDHHRGEYEVLRLTDEASAEARLRFRIPEFDERFRRRAEKMGLPFFLQNLRYALSRSHGNVLDPNHLAIGNPMFGFIEFGGECVDPLGLLRSCGEYQGDLIGRPGRGRGRVGTFSLRGGRGGLLFTSRQQEGEKEEGGEIRERACHRCEAEHQSIAATCPFCNVQRVDRIRRSQFAGSRP